MTDQLQPIFVPDSGQCLSISLGTPNMILRIYLPECMHSKHTEYDIECLFIVYSQYEEAMKNISPTQCGHDRREGWNRHHRNAIT